MQIEWLRDAFRPINFNRVKAKHSSRFYLIGSDVIASVRHVETPSLQSDHDIVDYVFSYQSYQKGVGE